MSAALLYVVLVVLGCALMLLTPFIFFGYLRSKRPHSKKKAEEKEHLNKKQAEASGTLPETAIDKKVKNKEGGKGFKWPLIVAGVILTLLPVGAMIVHGIWGKKTSTQQVQMRKQALPQDAPDLPRAWNADGTITDQSKWPRIQVPPHGDSVRVPSVFGGHIVWGGSGFTIHYVYADGRECVLGDASPSCGDGNIVSGYARNNGDILIYASYAYARQDEK